MQEGKNSAYKSFEEAVIANILSGTKDFVSSKALKLSSMLIESAGLENEHFNEGFSIGKTLYKMNAGKDEAAEVPEEKLGLLARFFENAGFGDVVIRFLAEGFEFKINKQYYEANFEIGIIAGFLNSLYGRYFYIFESPSKDFTILRASTNNYNDKMLKGAAPEIIDNESKESKISRGYWLLFRNLLTKKNVKVYNFKSYLKDDLSEIKVLKGEKKFKRLQKLAGLLGAKNIKIIKKNPMHMRIYYAPFDSNTFVDLSIDMFNTALEESFSSLIYEKRLSDNGRYIVDVKGSRAKYS